MQARIMMHYADMNTDGMIDYEEFLAFAVHQVRSCWHLQCAKQGVAGVYGGAHWPLCEAKRP